MGRIRAWRPVSRLLSESAAGREQPAIAEAGSLASRSALLQANTLAVEIRNAAARRGNRLIWSGVSAEIRRGEFLAVLGPNGVGKSTLVKVILGLLPLASGEVRVLGQPPGRANRDIGYLPQRRSFDPGLRVRGVDIVRLGLDGHRWGIPLPGLNRLTERAPEEVITAETLTRLYGTPIEVFRTADGHLVVVGQPEPPHGDVHAHLVS